ncbi:MAG: tetratricopeptide repeat protein [Candidatus Omnitrophota bacterium]|nr:tetratricopeptide repeat protein [Candidatus Omnitrophota bacterium]
MRRIAVLVLLYLTCAVCNVYALGFSTEEAISYYNEGVKAQKSGDFNGAFNAYQKTLLLAPDNLEYHKSIRNNLGIMYHHRGDLAGAEQAFKEALLIDPEYQAAKFNLGLIYDARRGKAASLPYWAQLLDLESLKPREFILEPARKKE